MELGQWGSKDGGCTRTDVVHKARGEYSLVVVSTGCVKGSAWGHGPRRGRVVVECWLCVMLLVLRMVENSRFGKSDTLGAEQYLG